MKSLITSLTALIVSTVATVATVALADPPATHGMLLFGTHATYASHLPMFHSPHDYQLVLKLNLKEIARTNTLKTYAGALKQGETLFTLVPEIMDLTKVIDGTKKTFAASIFLGHFERGGKNLGPVDVEVDSIVYSKKLDGNQPPLPFEESYLVFGEKGEYFAAHLIKEKPNFDAIVSVTQPQELITHSCRTRVCGDPEVLPVDDSLLPLEITHVTLDEKVQVPQVGSVIGSLRSSHADVLNVIYVEKGDLSH